MNSYRKRHNTEVGRKNVVFELDFFNATEECSVTYTVTLSVHSGKKYRDIANAISKRYDEWLKLDPMCKDVSDFLCYLCMKEEWKYDVHYPCGCIKLSPRL